MEQKIDGLDTGMDGKGLAKQSERLDEAARELKVRPLSEFFSADPEELSDFMEGEGIDTGGAELPALEQFSAQEGLATVRALRGHTAARDEHVAQDLQDCEWILSVAAEKGSAVAFGDRYLSEGEESLRNTRNRRPSGSNSYS